jgi:hypothetical protein
MKETGIWWRKVIRNEEIRGGLDEGRGDDE